MPVEFKLEYQSYLRKFHRVVYLIFLVLFLLSRLADLQMDNLQTVYLSTLILICWLSDEILFYPRKNVSTFAIDLRTILYILALAGGSFFFEVPVILVFPLGLYEICLLFEEMVMGDIFDDFSNVTRDILISILLFLGVYLPWMKDLDFFSTLFFILAAVQIFVLVLMLYRSYSRSVQNYNDRYTKLYFANHDILDESRKLASLQEKIEKVNSEINLQKINLTKANDELERNNRETRSLIEVMKFFSSNFNVPKNASRMIGNIMEVKKTSLCGFYMEPGTYMNEAPYLEVLSVNKKNKEILEQDILDIFNTVRKRKVLEPLVICDNTNFKYPFLAGMSISCAVAFPAFENDRIYGVMVVASGNYDFFESGYNFYESSLVDFTSAMISDRLYLQTEEMAKKDGLTHIYNRIYFNSFYPALCDEIIREKGYLAVAMMDIDHFKNVNDTYGHLAGDEVIKMVAHMDEKYAKQYGGTAVRFGGEEFLLILPGCTLDKARKILWEMHEEIASTVVTFEDDRIHVNTSMGLASYQETCQDIRQIVDRADHAMYYSKEHGRGRITIDTKEGETGLFPPLSE